jgi:hypothetical protein
MERARGTEMREQIKMRTWLAGIVLVLAAAGCGYTQKYQYLTDTTSGLIVQIPENWTVLEGDKILAVTAERLPEADNAVMSRWLYGFSAEAGVDAKNLLSPTAGKPGGVVRSRYLLQSEVVMAEGLAARTLLRQFNDMALIGEGDFIETGRSAFGVITESGVNGVGHTVELSTANGPMTVRYIVTVDPRVGQVNSFLIGCSTSCFKQYEKEINQVSRSFTVVDPSTLR